MLLLPLYTPSLSLPLLLLPACCSLVLDILHKVLNLLVCQPWTKRALQLQQQQHSAQQQQQQHMFTRSFGWDTCSHCSPHSCGALVQVTVGLCWTKAHPTPLTHTCVVAYVLWFVVDVCVSGMLLRGPPMPVLCLCHPHCTQLSPWEHSQRQSLACALSRCRSACTGHHCQPPHSSPGPPGTVLRQPG